MSGPRVSVIVPVFNGERFLGDAIESALSQDLPPAEVIVVDDGSEDGSAEVAASFDEVALIPHERNLRQPQARNSGIEAATGEYLAFLDADDMMAPGRLSSQVSHLEETPDLGAVLGRQEVLREEGSPDPTFILDPTSVIAEEPGVASLREDMPIHPHFPPMSMTARREAFEQIGGFDTHLELSEDVDWIFRAWEAGLRLATIDRVVLIRRVHDANLTHDLDGCRDALFEVFRARIARRRAAAGAARGSGQ
jgi:glycosyltransferase involved in cell wall biosynthesis